MTPFLLTGRVSSPGPLCGPSSCPKGSRFPGHPDLHGAPSLTGSPPTVPRSPAPI